jgi:hypothetical protein
MEQRERCHSFICADVTIGTFADDTAILASNKDPKKATETAEWSVFGD